MFGDVGWDLLLVFLFFACARVDAVFVVGVLLVGYIVSLFYREEKWVLGVLVGVWCSVEGGEMAIGILTY